MLHRNELVELGIRVVHDDQGLVPMVVLPHVVLDPACGAGVEGSARSRRLRYGQWLKGL